MKTSPTSLRVGVVGCGEVTRFKHLVALRRTPGIEVVALADTDRKRLDETAEHFRIPHRYADAASLLGHAGLDAVGVCVPAHSHAEVALGVLEAGKHLLVEKPLCLSLDEAERLEARATTADVTVLVGHHMRWHRLVRRIREAVGRGDIGEMESIRTVWNSPRVGRDNPGWRARRERGGGVLVEIAVHCFDLWRFITKSEVAEIFAITRHGGRDDEVLAVTARMRNGMLASGLFSEAAAHEIEMEVCGKAGRLRAGCLRADGLEFVPGDSAPGRTGQRVRRLAGFVREIPRGVAALLSGGDYFESYRQEWLHFAEAVRGEAMPACTLTDGRRSLEVVLAAAESANTGRPVCIDAAPRSLSPAAR